MAGASSTNRATYFPDAGIRAAPIYANLVPAAARDGDGFARFGSPPTYAAGPQSQMAGGSIFAIRFFEPLRAG